MNFGLVVCLPVVVNVQPVFAVSGDNVFEYIPPTWPVELE